MKAMGIEKVDASALVKLCEELRGRQSQDRRRRERGQGTGRQLPHRPGEKEEPQRPAGRGEADLLGDYCEDGLEYREEQTTMSIDANAELRSFGQYVAQIVESGQEDMSPEDALMRWRMQNLSPEELDEEVTAIREGAG